MLIENVTPFVRFAARQRLTIRRNVVGYDHRIYFCVGGRGTVVINGKSYPMKSDALLIWQAGSVYTYQDDGADEQFEVASCNFDYTRAAEREIVPVAPVPSKYFDKDKILSEPCDFQDNKAFNGVIYIENAAILRRPMLELCTEFQKTNRYRGLKLNALIQEIVYRTARIVDNEVLPQSAELAEKVVDFLHREYLNNPTLKEVSEHFAYHPNYLNTVILKHTGVPIHQYVINLKLNKALELLMNTNLTVNDISKEINVLDPRYFSRLFKKRYGKSPSDFRKNK